VAAVERHDPQAEPAHGGGLPAVPVRPPRVDEPLAGEVQGQHRVEDDLDERQQPRAVRVEQPDHRDREQQHRHEDEHLVEQELREAAADDAEPRPGTGHGPMIAAAAAGRAPGVSYPGPRRTPRDRPAG